MCSEDSWDGGALYVSVNGGAWNQAYVNYANGSNWYDGSITNTVGFTGTDVWDGRQYVAASGGWSCTSTVNIPWLDMEYDVSNLSGNNVSFRFRQMADSAVQEPVGMLMILVLKSTGLKPKALGCHPWSQPMI